MNAFKTKMSAAPISEVDLSQVELSLPVKFVLQEALLKRQMVTSELRHSMVKLIALIVSPY